MLQKRPGSGTTPAQSTLLACVLLVGAAGFWTPATAAQSQRREVSRLYEQLCAACHGADLRGGQARSLLDDEWVCGNGDDASLFHVIRDGDEPNGMPAWGNLLSDDEIRGLVIYLREKATEAQHATTRYPQPQPDQIVQSRWHRFRLRTVVEGLATPWSLAWLPDGRMLITELPGRLRVVQNGRLLPEVVAGTPPVRYRGQGGLMEVAVHPGYATNGWVYLAYSESASNAQSRDASMTTLVRGRLRGLQWSDQEVIWRAPLASFRPGNIHFGCRIVFGPDGCLYFSHGERGHAQDAQDLSRPNGKIHRIFDDGRIPPDNPFTGRPDAFPTIWSYGHRNPQGLAVHPVSRQLWETEHGPRGGDELNVIHKGRNYGWPVITYGMNYDGTPITAWTAREGMEQPVLHWTPSIAVCGMDLYRGDRFSRWRHHLFVTGLAAQELRRLELDGQRVVDQEILFKNIGRVRHVATGPDGFLYVVLNGPDRVVRLEPVEG